MNEEQTPMIILRNNDVTVIQLHYSQLMKYINYNINKQSILLNVMINSKQP